MLLYFPSPAALLAMIHPRFSGTKGHPNCHARQKGTQMDKIFGAQTGPPCSDTTVKNEIIAGSTIAV